jgi:hypothetical protein
MGSTDQLGVHRPPNEAICLGGIIDNDSYSSDFINHECEIKRDEHLD